MILSHDGRTPELAADVYVQATAMVIGDVVIGDESSLWFYVVLRGDVERIRIGRRTNVQDHTMIHVANGRWPTIVGDDVTIGHRVVLHGCTVGNAALIGIGAIVMDGAEIGEEALVGAGALVAPGTKIPPRMLALGSPAKPVRELRAAEIAHLHDSAALYVGNGKSYRAQGI